MDYYSLRAILDVIYGSIYVQDIKRLYVTLTFQTKKEFIDQVLRIFRDHRYSVKAERVVEVLSTMWDSGKIWILNNNPTVDFPESDKLGFYRRVYDPYRRRTVFEYSK